LTFIGQGGAKGRKTFHSFCVVHRSERETGPIQHIRRLADPRWRGLSFFCLAGSGNEKKIEGALEGRGGGEVEQLRSLSPRSSEKKREGEKSRWQGPPRLLRAVRKRPAFSFTSKREKGGMKRGISYLGEGGGRVPSSSLQGKGKERRQVFLRTKTRKGGGEPPHAWI